MIPIDRGIAPEPDPGPRPSPTNRPGTSTRARPTLQGLGWLSLWAFWVFVSRRNHPNLVLNLTASGLLVLTFAAGVTLHGRRLLPGLRRTRRLGVYGLGLLGLLAGLSFACAVAIRLVYDLAWGPDPARFSFGLNLVLEFVLVSFHVAVVAIAARVVERVQNRAGPPP